MGNRIQAGEAVTLEIAGAELTINAELITSMLLDRLQAHRAPPIAGAASSRLPAIGSQNERAEIYAGIARGMESERDYHVWLCARNPSERMTWADAMKWAEGLGDHASLPTRSEQALLFANLKDQFEEEWYWSREQSAGNAEYAWCQHFNNGIQSNRLKSSELRVRAVRRLPIE